MNSESAPSPWLTEKITPSFHPMKHDIYTETIVIGSGITGVTTAYLLSERGEHITLIDKATPAESATAYTTAFITQEIDTDLSDLVSLFGNEKTKAIWQSHGRAIDVIEEIVQKENIDCEFMRCPAYVYANNAEERKLLEKQAATAKQLSFSINLEKTSSLSFPNAGVMTIYNQAKFHPIKYISALIKAIHKNGGDIFYHTEAKNISGTGPVKVETNHGTITADNIVVATHIPFNNPIQTFAKKGVYTTYILEAEVDRNTFEEALYWDMYNPYHYFRIDKRNTHDRIIIGGEDHRHEIPVNEEKSYSTLEKYLQRVLQKNSYTITRKWNGQIVENIGVALIGRTKNNQYVATGHSGNGMTYGTIAGMIISDTILGRKNSWADLYDPSQIPSIKQLFIKTRDYSEEFIQGAVKNTFKSIEK